MALKLGNFLKKASDIWSSLQDEDDEYENSKIQPKRKLELEQQTLRVFPEAAYHADDLDVITEIIYTKNNVCVHVPHNNDPSQVVHHHGYLSVKSIMDTCQQRRQRTAHHDAATPGAGTLILTWIPNSRIEKNSRAVKVHSAVSSPRPSSTSTPAAPAADPSVFLLRGTTRRSPYHSRSPSPKHTNTNTNQECVSPDRESLQSLELSHDMKWKRSGSKGNTSITSHTDSGIVQDNESVQSHTSAAPLSCSHPSNTSSSLQAASRKHLHLDLANVNQNTGGGGDKGSTSGPGGALLSVKATTPDIAVTPVSDKDNDAGDGDADADGSSSTTTETTSNPDLDSDCYLDEQNHNVYPGGGGGPGSNTQGNNLLNVNPEFFVLTHNLNFPESVSPQQGVSPAQSPGGTGGGAGHRAVTKRERKCGVFSVDLGQMKSVSIFYNDDSCTCGQLVIASQESQYKILHFHHGGLDKLAQIFSNWHFLNEPKKRSTGDDEESQCKQFYICRPGQLSADQCHPEEGAYDNLTVDTWMSHMNDNGQIEDDLQLRKHIFFGGLSETLRSEAWPFLLHYYPFMSTFEEREQIRNDMYIKYQNIRKKREQMSGRDAELFCRNIENIVDKDVVRTDRRNPYFSGDNNPNLEVMRNILLNYAVMNPQMGYTQGMSDLLAPLLAEIQHESDAYCCFVGLMQRTIFISTPKDHDMDHQLTYLRELIRLMLPSFHAHLTSTRDAGELLFCHRWILLCFKREFAEWEALAMWEACWSQYQTDYFHLFICLAIMAQYGPVVVTQRLPADEMLLYFSNLAQHMNGYLVLRKARGLLHEFRARPRIPCTLTGLCDMCGAGMWDSGHVPVVECVAGCVAGCQTHAHSTSTTRHSPPAAATRPATP